MASLRDDGNGTCQSAPHLQYLQLGTNITANLLYQVIEKKLPFPFVLALLFGHPEAGPPVQQIQLALGRADCSLYQLPLKFLYTVRFV